MPSILEPKCKNCDHLLFHAGSQYFHGNPSLIAMFLGSKDKLAVSCFVKKCKCEKPELKTSDIEVD